MKYSLEFWNKTWERSYARYNRHHQEVWERVENLASGRICDLGCGPCFIWKDKEVDLTGVDISSKALEEAQINYPQGKYILADCRNTGLPNKVFDTVTLFGLLDYFEDWNEVLKEARRIRKDGGKIFATLLHGFNNHDWTKYPMIAGNWHLYEE